MTIDQSAFALSFTQEPIESFGATEKPIKAFKLDNKHANRIRNELQMRNAHICDYLLFPSKEEISTPSNLYLIEATDLWKMFFHRIRISIKDNSSRKVPTIFENIKRELANESICKIIDTLEIFKKLAEKYVQVGSLDSYKNYLFALMVPKGLGKSRDARFYANLKAAVQNHCRKKMRKTKLVGIMNDKVVWDYTSFLKEFNKRHHQK